ncbi:MAG: hypothetical protein ABH812_03075, partial [bacterium]
PKNKYTFTKTKMLISNNLVEVNFDGEYIQISKLRIVNQIKEPSVATGKNTTNIKKRHKRPIKNFRFISIFSFVILLNPSK